MTVFICVCGAEAVVFGNPLESSPLPNASTLKREDVDSQMECISDFYFENNRQKDDHPIS